MKEFIMGLAIGMAGGAVLVANSCKLRQMIKKNQDELMKKAETYIDEQLEKGIKILGELAGKICK